MDVMAFLDACKASDVKADAIITDPPYAISSNVVIARNDTTDLSMNFGDWDKFDSDEAFFKWTFEWVDKANDILRPGGIFVSFFDRDKVNFLARYLIRAHHYKRKNYFAWCLASSTKIFANISGKYELLTIHELYKRKGETILVPTQDIAGKNVWIRVKNVFDNGTSETLKITTRDGREIICTPDHEIVCKSSILNSKQSNYRQTRTIKAGNLGTSSHIYANVDTGVDLPDGDDTEYDDGYFVGFYIAEGSKRKRDDGGDKGIQLSCGSKDIERGYVAKLKRWKLHQYIYPDKPNVVHLRCNGNDIVSFINEYVDGNTCDTKKLKNTSFNRSKKFLQGVVDGFLEGDGHHDTKNDRWRLAIKPNPAFKDQLQLICRILGFDFRFSGTRMMPCNNGKSYPFMDIMIRKYHIRSAVHGCIVEKIKSVTSNGTENVYDLEVELLYNENYLLEWQKNRKYRYRYNPKYITGINNLYFLANGIWTHNCKSNPAIQFRKVKWSVGWEEAIVMQKPSGQSPVTNEWLYGDLTYNHQLGQQPDYYTTSVISGHERFEATVTVKGKDGKPEKDDKGRIKKIRHPTQKPVDLLSLFVKYWTNPGDLVIDPFVGCYDDQTEIMTEQRGFVRFEQLLPSDKVASLVDGCLEFVAPLRYFKYPHTGEMYRVKGRSIDLLVTPNHNLYCKEYHQESFELVPVSDVKYKTIHFKSTCDWNGEYHEWFYLPESSRSTGGKNRVAFKTDPVNRIKMDDWLEFLGYFISEGSTTKYLNKCGQYIVQIRQKNGWKKDKIHECLKRLPFHFKEIIGDGGRFLIYKKQLYDFLSVLGKSKDKHVPFEFKKLCKAQLKILFDALMLGDGSKTTPDGLLTYHTVSPTLRDDVCELMLKIGHSPSVTGRIREHGGTIVKADGTSYIIHSDKIQYDIRAKTSENIKLHPSENFTTEQHDGPVYCVEVPSHVIYVRRNGKCCWCGNSGSTAVACELHRRKWMANDGSKTWSRIAKRRLEKYTNQGRLDDYAKP
jgi:DNA modification methylase